MRKLLFVCEHLPNQGGIGTALINQLKSLDKSVYDVSLCMIGNYVDKNVEIPDDVKILKGSKLMEYHIIDYHKRKNEYSIFEKPVILLMKKIRRVIGFEKFQKLALRNFKIKEKFDVAVSYSNDICRKGIAISGGSNYCVKNCVNADRKIAWVHNEVEHQGFTKEYCLENFKDYDYVVNVSNGCKKLFDDMVPEYKEKSKVIYNVIDLERIKLLLEDSKPEEFDAEAFNIVTAARIEEGQKKISRILECAKHLKEENIIYFNWYVLGDGPDFEKFRKVAEEMDIDDVLHFIGRKNNPFVYMKYGDVFVLPSLYESFGMVLKEALASGCPVITTDFAASREIIEDGVTGIICDNSAQGIYSALKQVIDNPTVLEDLESNIKASCYELNFVAKIQFDNLIKA